MTQQRKVGPRPLNTKRKLTRDRLQYLLQGYNFFGEAFVDDADAEKCWRDHGPKIMRSWIKSSPGSRPWAWWKFDATERRRCTSGKHPFDEPDFESQRRKTELDIAELRFGIPQYFSPEQIKSKVRFETEEDYLKRLNLMSDYELIRLANAASFQSTQKENESKIAKQLNAT